VQAICEFWGSQEIIFFTNIDIIVDDWHFGKLQLCLRFYILIFTLHFHTIIIQTFTLWKMSHQSFYHHNHIGLLLVIIITVIRLNSNHTFVQVEMISLQGNLVLRNRNSNKQGHNWQNFIRRMKILQINQTYEKFMKELWKDYNVYNYLFVNNFSKWRK